MERYLFSDILLHYMQKNDNIKATLRLTLKKNGTTVDAEVEITPNTFDDLWMKYVIT